MIDPKINLDLHLLLDGVGGARFEQGVSRTPTKVNFFLVIFFHTNTNKKKHEKKLPLKVIVFPGLNNKASPALLPR